VRDCGEVWIAWVGGLMRLSSDVDVFAALPAFALPWKAWRRAVRSDTKHRTGAPQARS
jgi:hypothetical protein